MRNFNITPSQYQEILDSQRYNGVPVSEIVTGERRCISISGTKRVNLVPEGSLNIGGIQNKYFGPFLAQFKKCLYRQFDNNPELISLVIPDTGLSVRHSNPEMWNNIEIGDYFYNIDFKSAYWQFAHQLGYIDDKLFSRYMDDNNYKQAKRYCISFLARKAYSRYLNSAGEETHIINCDITIFNQIYTNIRHRMYTVIQDAVKSTDKWINYNQDSISITKEATSTVKSVFRNNNIVFKNNLCQKINASEYTQGCKIKKFTGPLITPNH